MDSQLLKGISEEEPVTQDIDEDFDLTSPITAVDFVDQKVRQEEAFEASEPEMKKRLTTVMEGAEQEESPLDLQEIGEESETSLDESEFQDKDGKYIIFASDTKTDSTTEDKEDSLQPRF